MKKHLRKTNSCNKLRVRAILDSSNLEIRKSKNFTAEGSFKFQLSQFLVIQILYAQHPVPEVVKFSRPWKGSCIEASKSQF